MSGLKMTSKALEAVLAAVKTPPAGGDFVWDGKDEDERPLSRAQMQAGVLAYRKQRGRPAGSGTIQLQPAAVAKLAQRRQAGPCGSSTGDLA